MSEEVYEDYHPKPGEDVIYVNNWFLYTSKYNQFEGKDILKARLIHVCPEEVHKKAGDPAPVADKGTFMLMLCFLASFAEEGYEFITIDIHTAFLAAEIDIAEKYKNRVYLTRPSAAFQGRFKTRWVKLKKSCYGLNIAPFNFYRKLVQVLVEKMGFERNTSDHAFFYHKEHGFIISHVDDLAIFSKDPKKVYELITEHLKTKVSTEPELYVGYELNMKDGLLTLGSAKYIESKFPDMFDEDTFKYICLPTVAPATSHFNYLTSPPNGDPSRVNQEYVDNIVREMNEQKYKSGDKWIKFKLPEKGFQVKDAQRLMGVLTYLSSHTRWDIQFYTSTLSRYNNTPTTLSYINIINLFRFVYSTRYFHTTFMFKRIPASGPTVIIDIYSDASYNSNFGCSSQRGHIITMNGNYWHSTSKRITTTVSSSYTAELLGVYNAVCYVQKHHRVLEAVVQISNSGRPKFVLHCDNQALVKVINNVGDLQICEAPEYAKPLEKLIEWRQTMPLEVRHIKGTHNMPDYLTKFVTAAVRIVLFRETILNLISNASLYNYFSLERKKQSIGRTAI